MVSYHLLFSCFRTLRISNQSGKHWSFLVLSFWMELIFGKNTKTRNLTENKFSENIAVGNKMNKKQTTNND